MIEAIKYNLTHLTDFSGRENRPTFWWYVLFLVILNIVLSLALTGPMVATSMSSAFDAAQAGLSPDEAQAQIMASMSGQMSTMLWISGAISLLMIALSVAAFVRRLHDSNNSGWWAALAVAAQVVAFALSLSMIGTMQDMMTNAAATGSLGTMQEVQGRMSTYSLIGWIAPLVVIVFGVMGSTAGSNRYGEPQAA